MIESAPFERILTSPSYCLMMTDILFLADENSITLRSSTLRDSTSCIMISILLSSSLPLNQYPKNKAALTKAYSSGDVALNF